MTLYRMKYLRRGKQSGVTFTAATDEEAWDFVAFWEKLSGVTADSLVALRQLMIQGRLL